MANEERGRGPKVYIPVTLDHYRTGNYQPETIAIIKWTENHNFVLSAMIHSGAWESFRDTIFTSKIFSSSIFYFASLHHFFMIKSVTRHNNLYL